MFSKLTELQIFPIENDFQEQKGESIQQQTEKPTEEVFNFINLKYVAIFFLSFLDTLILNQLRNENRIVQNKITAKDLIFCSIIL